MTFETWYDGYMYWHDEDEVDQEYLIKIASAAWNHQQERIDELNECLEQALSDLKYWEEKASALEYDKTLTGDRAV